MRPDTTPEGTPGRGPGSLYSYCPYKWNGQIQAPNGGWDDPGHEWQVTGVEPDQPFSICALCGQLEAHALMVWANDLTHTIDPDAVHPTWARYVQECMSAAHAYHSLTAAWRPMFTTATECDAMMFALMRVTNDWEHAVAASNELEKAGIPHGAECLCRSCVS